MDKRELIVKILEEYLYGDDDEAYTAAADAILANEYLWFG